MPFWFAPFITAPLWFLLRGRHATAFFLLFLTFSLVGLIRVSLCLEPPVDNSQVYLYCGPSPVVLEGLVLQVNPRGSDQSSVDISAQLISSQGIATTVSGRVRLYIGSGRPDLLYGDRVRFRSRLQRPRTFGVPGEFDMSRYLAYSDIWATAYLPSPESLVRFAGGRSGLLRQLARLKQQSGVRIDQAVSPEISPLVRALTLGERGAISLSQRQHLARGGVAHLFAISGLHMGLLALFGYQLLLFIYRRSSRLLRWQPPQLVLPLILLPLLFVYLLLTGDALSTRRAFLTCTCIAFLLVWKRRVAPLQILSTLALLFLLLEPLALWQASFQLSFAGVAGILYWNRYWLLEEFRQHWLLKKIFQIFLVSLAATLATAPLVLLNFQMFSIAGIINNLFAIPLVGLLAVPSGLLGVILTAFSPALADPFFIFCGHVLSITVQMIEWATLIPGLSGEMLYLSRWQLIFFTIISLVLMLPWKRLVSPVLILLVLLLFFFFPTWQDQRGLSLISFAVGQGDSFLLSIHGDRHILVDGGGLYSDSFDVGERLLAPALGLLGVRRLDAVLLTHDHPDHSKGLSYLLEHFPVGSFWCGSKPSGLSSGLRVALIKQKIPVRQFAVGWTEVSAHSGGSLSVYVPDLKNGSKNDRSVAVYVDQGQDGLLLTGDLEQAGTAALLNAGVPGPVTLLKLPHHGSRHSGSQLLLEKLHPEKALVSVGYQNHYRFPSPEVVKAIRKNNARLYRTDLAGTLHFISQGEGWQVEQWENGLFR